MQRRAQNTSRQACRSHNSAMLFADQLKMRSPREVIAPTPAPAPLSPERTDAQSQFVSSAQSAYGSWLRSEGARHTLPAVPAYPYAPAIQTQRPVTSRSIFPLRPLVRLLSSCSWRARGGLDEVSGRTTPEPMLSGVGEQHTPESVRLAEQQPGPERLQRIIDVAHRTHVSFPAQICFARAAQSSCLPFADITTLSLF